MDQNDANTPRSTSLEYDFLISKSDGTWDEALNVVRSSLEIPSVLPTLVKNCWGDLYGPHDFIRAAGFPGWNAQCLLRAAQNTPSGEKPSSLDVEQAVSKLGVKPASVVLVVNFVCQAVLRTNPPQKQWTPLFREMMSLVEVGYHFGTVAHEVGTGGGMLMGFVKKAGLALLLAQYPRQFADWYKKTDGVDSRLPSIEAFGCQPYQVGALALQQLGFGPEVAVAAALATGDLEYAVVEVKPTVVTWKAAFQWINALHLGQGRPTDPEACAIFSRLPLMQQDDAVPPEIEALYAHVARVRGGKSEWVWHLPFPSYEATLDDLNPARAQKKQRYVVDKGARTIIMEK
jgi:hypothetical protein